MMAGVVFTIVFVLALRRSRTEGRRMPGIVGWFGKGVLLTIWVIVAGLPAGLMAFAVLAPVVLSLLAPVFVLRVVIVPLGMPRLAYWVARLLSPTELVNDSGLGACYGALALARRRSPARQSGEWLAGKVDGARFPRGPGVVAAGLLAALRQDRDAARRLFEFADGLDGELIRRDIRVVARDWLVAEAAHRGDWRLATRLGRRGWRSLRWSYCMARIGERLSGAPRPCHAAMLWIYWVVAPRRHATYPLLRQALGRPTTPKTRPEEVPDLPTALGGVAHRIARSSLPDRETFAKTLSALDIMLDGAETRALVQRRLLALGAPESTETVLSDVRTRLTDLVAPFVDASPWLGGEETGSAILDQASDQVRARWFKDVEAQCKDYRHRTDAETVLGTITEWEIWAALRHKADRLLDLSPASERVLFQSMFLPVNNFAVFQQNRCKRVMLARDMYSWLVRHAGHDATASQLLGKNIRSCRL